MCTLWEQLDMISEGYCLFEIVVSREMILSHKMKSYLWSWCRQAESLFYIYGSNYENILHFHSLLLFLACLLIWLVDKYFQTVFNSLTILWVFNGFVLVSSLFSGAYCTSSKKMKYILLSRVAWILSTMENYSLQTPWLAVPSPSRKQPSFSFTLNQFVHLAGHILMQCICTQKQLFPNEK